MEEYFKEQQPHQHNGLDCYFVLANLNKKLEVFDVPVSELPIFLEEVSFVHMSGAIPRFQKKVVKADGNTQVPV